jgi:hypothetical protein
MGEEIPLLNQLPFIPHRRIKIANENPPIP